MRISNDANGLHTKSAQRNERRDPAGRDRTVTSATAVARHHAKSPRASKGPSPTYSCRSAVSGSVLAALARAARRLRTSHKARLDEYEVSLRRRAL